MEERFYITPEDLVRKLRTRAENRGLVGLRGMGTLYRQAEENGDQMFTVAEDIPKVLADFGVFMNKTEIAEMCRYFDAEEISLSEFVNWLAPPLSPEREEWVEKAFAKHDRQSVGSLDIRTIKTFSNMGSFGTARLATRRGTPEAVFQNLVKYYEQECFTSIPREDFFDYYREVSANIATDREFIDLIKRTWEVGFK